MSLNYQTISRGIFNISAFIFIFTFSAFCENPDLTLKKINNKASDFQKSSKCFGINPAILKSIVYVERTLNFDWKDDAFDTHLAQSGYNSSIGFCQVKMKTAYWIELQLSDSTSDFYPGKQFHGLLPISKSPGEIIKKLQNDSLNIMYAAAYIKIMQRYWKKAGYPIADRADILGTLFSIGLFDNKGEVRRPNANPKPNAFGEKVIGSYKLFCNG
jgi:hypothetical protein